MAGRVWLFFQSSLGILLFSSFSCSIHSDLGQLPQFEDRCLLLSGSVDEEGTVVVALHDDVDPGHAPVPHNASERLLFRHFYETLLRIDCAGQIAPGLAVSWQSRNRGREWHFTLREGARFWDGSPVTAADVVASWQEAAPTGSNRVALPWEGPEVAEAIDEQRVRVRLAEPRSRVPREFADLGLCVVRHQSGSAWPMGSGRYRPSGPTREVLGGDIRAFVTAYPTTSTPSAVLRFRLAAGENVRDLLDESVDLLILHGLSLEEARAWPEYVVRLLPWEKTYVLASPEPQGLESLRLSLPTSERDALARDVLRTTARGAGPPAWWSTAVPCGLAFSPGPPRTTQRRVVFDAEDPQAHALAERVVALAKEPLRAVPLAPDTFAASLEDGTSFLYVLALPSQVGSPCAETQTLLDRAPWLLGRRMPEPSVKVQDLSLEKRLLPLVETRPILMARQGLVGIGIDADGTVQLDRIGWSRAGESP